MFSSVSCVRIKARRRPAVLLERFTKRNQWAIREQVAKRANKRRFLRNEIREYWLFLRNEPNSDGEGQFL